MPTRYKRPYRRRRIVRKYRPRRRRQRIMRFNPRIHNFKETIEFNNIATATTSQYTYFGLSVNASMASNMSSLSSLFDSYRIMGIKFSFYPQYNVSYTQGVTVAGEIPMIYTAVDYDSDTAPTTLSVVEQYATCRRQFFNRPHSRYFKPKPTAYAAVTTSSSGYGTYNLSRSTWMDMGNLNVKYFGIIGCIVFTNSSALPPATQVRVTATLYYQCKGQR